IGFKTYKDQVIFEQNEVLKDNGTPYTVFTPYSRKWKALMTDFHFKSYPTEAYFGSFFQYTAPNPPTLAAIGFRPTDIQIPAATLNRDVAQRYDQTRDLPAIAGTTRLSVHLRFGTVSIRQLAREARSLNDKLLGELIWRDFYMMILWHFPHVAGGPFKKEYGNIEWANHPEHFEHWRAGTTGIPIVDAGMRELSATGYMHNRVRMIVASFLTKNLLTDWRLGEAWFAEQLLDFDLSANNGGWQWAAGSGCDAAPYFRVFNPILQTQKFDPQQTYIRKWVPEVHTCQYPRPIVDLAASRERCLAAYKKALGGGVTDTR
ncbi:MAG: deoxyribodipyrimidine photo-lyase, partial [Chitinophagia bacterium]|nr:deoxyribodipyrimidine photo-lyase [Chitinophagia bacterium]